jgi:hypothetical protein
MLKRQRHTPEQVIAKPREAEVKTAKGVSIARVCKDLVTTENPYYRWRREYCGMKVDLARRLRDLERENARLERMLAEANRLGRRWLGWVISRDYVRRAEERIRAATPAA